MNDSDQNERWAGGLAVAIGGPTGPLLVKEKLSTLCRFFADDDRLLVIARPDLSQLNVDHSLAWGLAYRGDRQLTLLLPEPHALPTLVRAPWIAPTVRVLTYGRDGVGEPQPLTEWQSIECYRHWVGAPPTRLGSKAAWVQPLLDWLPSVPSIEQVELKGYVSWQVLGRQVLKITPSKNKLSVVAGVNAKDEFLGKNPVALDLSGEASPSELLRVLSAVAVAAADRLDGLDTWNLEHQMQALLTPDMIGLDGQRWFREFPAWRPSSKRSAFIDFLGKNHSGRPEIVETKIGPDTMLAFQGLDYWLWCRANQTEVHHALHSDHDGLPGLTFVVAPKHQGGDLLSIYTAAHLEALHRTLPWRIAVVDDPANVTDVQLLSSRTLPDNVRRANSTPSRWALRLHRHAVAIATTADHVLVNGHTHSELSASLLPAAIEAHARLSARGLVHPHIAHVRSSQGFALNMLAPLNAAALTKLVRGITGDGQAEVTDPLEFEYSDPVDELREATHASPHATQVDCVVRATLGDRTRHLVFIEVKLSEDSFSGCSAYASAKNPRREICANPLPFGGDVTGCFQLANHDREHRRRYDIALSLPEPTVQGHGCWFRDGTNQVMRNTALARQLIMRRETDSASVVLLAPDDHRAIWHQWHEHTTRLEGTERIRFVDLRASAVASLHDHETAKLLRDRYLLPPAASTQ